MPRPASKDELLKTEARRYRALIQLIDALPAEQRTAEFPFEDRDRRVSDVVNHLYAWQQMMLDWYQQGMSGTKPEIPAPGYSWKRLPDLNAMIWERTQAVSLSEALAHLASTRERLVELIEKHSDDELFTKKYYPWTGSTSLGAYLISATSSHYDWALKKLRKAKRAWQQAEPGA